MRAALPFVCLLVLGLAGCGEPVADNHFENDASPAAEAAPAAANAWAVRVGEYGVNFDACPWVGTTRHVDPGGALPVRASPFDNGEEIAAVPAGGRFFVCSRSLDQKWFGIVHDETGTLAPRCGVSEQVAATRAYDGPCRSGWVASAFVKLIAGNDQVLPPPNQAGPAPPEAAPAPAQDR